MNGKRILGTAASAAIVLFLMAGLRSTAGAGSAAAQAPDTPLGTAFTYQGQIKVSDTPYGGMCDLKFVLYDALTHGTPLGTLSKTRVPVSDGIFTVSLDYGAAKFTGDARWLEISVRCPAGLGTYQLLSPRQPLTAAPAAQSLVLPFSAVGSSSGALVTVTNSGTGDGLRVQSAGAAGVVVPSAATNGVSVSSAGQNGVWVGTAAVSGLYVESATDDGVHVASAGNHGVSVGTVADSGLYVSSAGGDAVYVWSAAGDGARVWSAGGDGVSVHSAADDGMYVESAGSPSTTIPSGLQNGFEVAGAKYYGLWVGRADSHGLCVQSAGYDGLRVTSAGYDGVDVESAGDQGVYVGSAGTDGMRVGSAGSDGLHVDAAAGHGVYVQSSADDGVHVKLAGNPSQWYASDLKNGLEVAGAEGRGLYIGRADDTGVFVASAGDRGVEVWSADDMGVYVRSTGGDGVYVDMPADDGLWVSYAADYAIYANTNQANWQWGLYTPDAIYAGAPMVSASPSMIVAQNGGAVPLEAGDVVAVSGRGAHFADSGFPAPLVRRAGSGGAVAGVVYGRFVAEEEVDEIEHDGQVETRITVGSGSTEGPAAPGEFLLVVMMGQAQVKAGAASGSIAAGDLLAAAGDGQAALLLPGAYVPGTVVGTAMEALEEAQGSGLIWVLVSPR